MPASLDSQVDLLMQGTEYGDDRLRHAMAEELRQRLPEAGHEGRPNAESCAAQAFKILDPALTRVEYNDSWLSKLSFEDVIRIASLFTVQQFLTRDNFRQRWGKDEPIYLHEMFYSLMQGYDAFHLRADVQDGGTDQLFNIMTAARKLMEALGARAT